MPFLDPLDPYGLEADDQRKAELLQPPTRRCGVWSEADGVCEKPPVRLLTVRSVAGGTLAYNRPTCLRCCLSFERMVAHRDAGLTVEHGPMLEPRR